MMHLFLAVEDPLDDVLPHTFFSFLGIHFNNQMIMVLVAAILMLLIFPRLARHSRNIPTNSCRSCGRCFSSFSFATC
jgi:hypothetical protein